MSTKMIDLLNTIRDNASAEYQERIPEANANNIENIQSLILGEDNIAIANEFTSLMMNKFVKSWIHNKLFTNPLKSLKKGNKPLGDTVEEIYNNFLKGTEYDPTGANLMNRNLPDTKVVYHRMNHQMQYPITIGREQLRKAFLSYDNLDSFVSNIMNSLYNSAELDEFVNVKNLITLAMKKGAMVEVEVTDPLLGETEGKEFIKSVKTISKQMTFPSKLYNGYLKAQKTDAKAITTFSRKEEQVLILDATVDTSVAIDVLASTFNMSVAEFNDTKKIVIDSFADKRVRAVLVDKGFFQVFDDLFTISEFYNGKGLYTNYYLNVWQTMAYSILVNAVAFVVPDAE